MVYLIYGSPCSGKSYYVNQHMTEDDLVCDVDLIYSAISGRDPHDADLYIHEIALTLYNNLLDMIRDRAQPFKDAYVMSIANTPEKVKADMERVNADSSIFIDTPFETCLERAKDREEYFKWLIEEWFETQTIV